jgi:uncharacterized membrane protein
MLTDAVVAIAMTLLVLPLVEISGEVDTDDLSGFVAEHDDLLLSFVVSFLVIYVFWAAHREAFARAAAADVQPAALRSLTMLWLLVIAFLPFPTALVGRGPTTSSAPFYVGTMLVLSVLTSTVATVVDRATQPPKERRRAVWAWATTAVFAMCTLLATVSADAGLYGLLLLALLRVVEVRVLDRRAAAPRTARP